MHTVINSNSLIVEDSMHFRRRTLTLASIAIGIASLGLASSTTSIQAQTKQVQTKQTKPLHCVKNLEAPDAAAVCHDTFTAAIAAATLGQVADAPADIRDGMTDERLLRRLNHTGEKRGSAKIEPRAGIVIAILYADANYRGSSLTLTASRPCTGPLNPVEFHVADLRASGWNDRAESIRLFANCYARLWQHINFQGAMLDFAGDRSDFGSVMAEEVSSLQFS